MYISKTLTNLPTNGTRSWLAWFEFFTDNGEVRFMGSQTWKNIQKQYSIGLDMINAAYHEKLLMFIGTTLWEKLVFHHQAVNINC